MTQLTDAYIDGLVQERHNSIAIAMEQRFSCTNPVMCVTQPQWVKHNTMLCRTELQLNKSYCLNHWWPWCDLAKDAISPHLRRKPPHIFRSSIVAYCSTYCLMEQWNGLNGISQGHLHGAILCKISTHSLLRTVSKCIVLMNDQDLQ